MCFTCEGLNQLLLTEMPYIEQKDRKRFESFLDEWSKVDPEHMTSGELNYVISSMIWYIFDKKKSYTKANEIIGALDCIKREFYRRKVAPYEDSKMQENGDVKIKQAEVDSWVW